MKPVVLTVDSCGNDFGTSKQSARNTNQIIQVSLTANELEAP